jgi:hypothetical protein
MGDLTGASPDIVYADRASILRTKGIALWDVCLSAIRPGSLDSKILSSMIIPNDFDVSSWRIRYNHKIAELRPKWCKLRGKLYSKLK